MRTIIVTALVSLLFLGCSKEESKEAKLNRICEKIHKEETAACAGEQACLDEAKSKLGACKQLSKTVGETEKGGAPKSMEDQVSDEQKKCDGGDQDACATLGGAYMLGKGVDKDEKKGFELAKKACDANNANGCEMLARAYERGMGVTADKALMATHMEKACNLGAGGGCRSFALSFDNTDPKRIPLLEKACDLKDTIGCMGLGAAYLNGGQGTDKDLVKAKKYLQMACDLDPAKADTACQKAKEI
jgi:TPR repeat protein